MSVRLVPGPRLRSALFDGLVSAGVVGLTSLGIFERGTPDAAMWPGFVMAAAVLFRRRWPMWSMAVISLAALAQVIQFPPSHDPLPYDLAVLVGMYSVVKYAKPRIAPALAAATVASGIVIEVVRHPRTDPVALSLFYVGVCGGVWLMAYTMRVRRTYVLALESRAANLERERDHLARIAAADERAAIARELHDVVAHSLAVMIVQADGGRYAFDTDPAQARAALDTVATTGREALEDMRRLVGLLRGSQPDEPAEPEPEEVDRRRAGLEQLPGLVERATSAGLEVDLRVDGPAATLPPAVELAVFRLVQEALTNVIRHAGARARVDLRVRVTPEAVAVSVVDDGGEDPTPPTSRPEPGHGLIGMRERVAVHGGTLDVGPRPQRGWAVHASIPLTRAVVAAAPAEAVPAA